MASPRQYAAELKARFSKRAKKTDLNKKQLQQLGKSIVNKMKDIIAKGNSPIDKKGRFPAYKNPKRYPAKQKPKRPVNLHLSGDFLKDLRVLKVIAKKIDPVIRIGFKKKINKLKERGHREGAMGQPLRPIIPLGNESLSSRVLLEAKRILRDIVKSKS